MQDFKILLGRTPRPLAVRGGRKWRGNQERGGKQLERGEGKGQGMEGKKGRREEEKSGGGRCCPKQKIATTPLLAGHWVVVTWPFTVVTIADLMLQIFTPSRWGCGVLWSTRLFVHLCVCLSASSVCLSAGISLEPLDRSSRNFVCRSDPPWLWLDTPFSYYVLLVLWMMSRLAIVGHMALRGRPERLAGLAVSYMRDWGGVWCLWMPCCVYCMYIA